MEMLIQKIFHAICIKNPQMENNYAENYFQKGLADAEEFFKVRFRGKVNFEGKTILDIGCGYGSTCIYLAENGARKVVGVDIDENRISFAESLLLTDFKYLSSVVEFKNIDEICNRSNYEKFDIVLSKDSFEHYADPDNIIVIMKKKLKKNGIMVIGFGPLWKAPYGGHIQFMTKVPWAHLIFPESVIMAERKRFRPDEDAKSFEQILGGLNKMTLNKFLTLIRKNRLEFEYFKVNRSPTKLMFLFNILRRIPLCREFFTQNVYCVARLKKIQQNRGTPKKK
jgi:2-polyprenyl-3-methyl-5-hydroxy-6-metoxy-1,4-benzoquinol methylase